MNSPQFITNMRSRTMVIGLSNEKYPEINELHSRFPILFRCLFLQCLLDGAVDAVYAMAHALHQNIKEKCGTMDFRQCDELLPAPFGADLLRSIRDVSFVGMQGTQVMAKNREKEREKCQITGTATTLAHIAHRFFFRSLFLLCMVHSSFRFDSIRTGTHMDIIIFININDMGKNLITFRLAPGKKRN